MNHRHIARLFLSWFDQEASKLSKSLDDGSTSVVYDLTGEYVVSYVNIYGTKVRAREFVYSLAHARLDRSDCDKVVAAAHDLLNHN